jgi:hypothetical protein
MRFLRTAPTARLLATLTGFIILIAAGGAIAVAATSGGPVPKPKRLAAALHAALAATPVKGITADITFTNNLISSADFTGDAKDPILQGAGGRLWVTASGLRMELQSTNGDAQVVVDHGRFWISDPASSTVYEGTLPADSSAKTGAKKSSAASTVPTVAQIQKELGQLMGHLTLGGSQTSDPTDIGGRPAYSVTVSPKHSGGLLGAAQVAWDAVTGVPLDIAVYARDNPTPVIQLEASNISYGKVSPSVFDVSPAAGDKVVKIASTGSSLNRAEAKGKHQKPVSGLSAVASHVPFTLAAPASIVGLPRQETKLLSMGGSPAALITYGEGAGGIAVIEHAAAKGSSNSTSSASGGGLSLPTVSINGTTAQELATALGTVLQFQRSGVAYTVIGSVPPYVAEKAAEAVTAGS